MLILLLTTFALSSCGEKAHDDSVLTLAQNGKSDYVLVIPYSASNTIANAALSIKSTALRQAGIELEVFVDKEHKHEDGAYEILVGETDRTLPNELVPETPMSYTIAANENSIVILGGSDTATANAVEYFCNTLLQETTIIEKDFVYKYVHEYTPISVDSIEARAFDVVTGENFDASRIADVLGESVGVPCSVREPDSESGDETGGTVTVLCELDRTLSERTVRISVRDGDIVISGSSDIAMSMIPDVLKDELALCGSLELKSGEYTDFTYDVQSVTSVSDLDKCYFDCTTNRSPIEYKVGEEMVFTLTLKYDGETVSAPGFAYTVEFDGEKESVYDTADGTSGSFEIRTCIDVPGFVKIYAAPTSEFGVELMGVAPFEGGAGADIDKIMQAVEEPDDFEKFWQDELAKLDEISPEVTVIEDLSSEYPGYTVLDIRIDCIDGPAYGYLSIPENAEAGSLGILVGFMGYGVVSPYPTQRSDRIVFVANAHSIENGRESSYYNEIAATVLYSYGFDKSENANRDSVYFKNMILRDVQILRYLKTLEEWDGKTLVLNGGSQGAYQAIAAAALDPDVTFLYAVYPWLCDLGGETVGRIDGWQPEFTDALGYYDAVSFAKRVKCETRLGAGLGDYVAPPSGACALYNAITSNVSIEFTQGMTHTYTPPSSEIFKINK